jgi:ComF family protein
MRHLWCAIRHQHLVSGVRRMPASRGADCRAAMRKLRRAARIERQRRIAMRPCIAHRPAFRRARALARYRSSAEDESGTLPALLRPHKYGLDQAAGRALAEYLDGQFPFDASDYEVVVPIPLHRHRLWWRGFNQAALLASEVAMRTGLPLDAASVARSRFTPPQTARDHDDRRRNVARAFLVRRPASVRGRRILLVDDVMTRGATADECARVIVAAGATSVDVFTLGRVL